MKVKRTLSLVLCAVMLLGLLSGCGGKSGGSGASNEFTWFLRDTDASQYYSYYQENPTMQYLMNKGFEDADGNSQTLSIEFQAPAAGKGQDNFNTMIQTQSETDILDTTFSSDGVLQLYKDGVIMDITEYVEAYMPNYVKMLQDNGVYNMATYEIDGQRRFLSISGYSEVDYTQMFCGWCYRRDWIVKYGVQPDTLFDPMKDSAPQANPNAGKSFSGSCQVDGDYDTWTDDVVFPSGNTDPIYISDWEWMFEIFAKAQQELGITDSYVLSMYYPGYNENGDLVSSFGGGNPAWYMEDGHTEFGAANENFKVYLECIKNWYDKGWLDHDFASRTQDMFYQIDDSNVRQGKIGFWCGQVSTLGSRISNASFPLTEGAVVFGARNPINDVYGSDEQKLKVPDSFYSNEPFAGAGLAFAAKNKDGKNWASLFRMLDYLYSEEGQILRTVGMNAEQLTEAPQSAQDYYAQYGLSDGAYTVEEIDGETYYRLAPILDEDVGLYTTICPERVSIGYKCNTKVLHNYGDTMIHSWKEWVAYENTGFIGGVYRSQMTAEENKKYSQVRSEILLEYMQIEVPKFINGAKDLEADWDSFTTNLARREYDTVNAIFDRIIAENS